MGEFELFYDLHIHSSLSPCGNDDADPASIAQLASMLPLDVVALTDHNTSKNCPAFFKAAEEAGIIPIAGMELTTEEEIHVLCLFPTIEKAMDFDDYVYDRIFPVKNNPDIYGTQNITGKDGSITGVVEKSLINATSIGLYDIKGLMDDFHGLMIPAHIERTALSLISVLGWVPEDCGFDTVEIRSKDAVGNLKQTYPYLAECKIIHNSDAHMLENISLPINKIMVKEKSAMGVLCALSENYSQAFKL